MMHKVIESHGYGLTNSTNLVIVVIDAIYARSVTLVHYFGIILAANPLFQLKITKKKLALTFDRSTSFSLPAFSNNCPRNSLDDSSLIKILAMYTVYCRYIV